ncbi:WcbI family polysaccharide biosynthesis putative acetyltransferase [Burkholderia aenigmatica]|uniref:WcbI family polysaccharide biosynthesis putative acetyltransferase n=1 Tax=Burkholderia aenigmatica TaxID=2015348 RepID=UPI003B43A8B2
MGHISSAAGNHPTRGERWIVMSNCQTLGLANCLAQQNPGIEVEACDIWEFKRNRDIWIQKIAECDHLFLNVDLQSEHDFSATKRVTIVPSLWFGGYHPDVCIITANDAPIKTPLDDYNSIIAVAAYKKGLSVSEALTKFNGDIYKAAGYYNTWNTEKDFVLPYWKNMGYDLTACFRQWTMREAFMYSSNHPHIDCLYDVAAIATKKAGYDPILGTGSLRPHDNLKHGAIYPIYPEIAEALGVTGSYWFKRPNRYGLLSLEEFVTESYASYQQVDRDAIQINHVFSSRYELVYNAI